MQCPGCSGQLSATLYEGVEIHSCSMCQGNWLVEEAIHEIETKRVISIPRNKSHSRSGFYDGSRSCPVCSVIMEKAKYGKYISRTIDKCPQCKKIWLDEGELEDIQVAYEMYEENTGKVKRNKPDPPKPAFVCPKCGFEQEKSTDCIKCGIYFEKYASIQTEKIKEALKGVERQEVASA